MPYKLPLTKNFNSDLPIGEVTIYNDKFKIPLNSVISFGIKIGKDGMVKGIDPKTKKSQVYIVDGEVYEATLTTNDNYRRFLNSSSAKELHPPKELLKKKK